MLKIIDSETIKLQEIQFRNYSFAWKISDIIRSIESIKNYSSEYGINDSLFKDDPWVKEFEKSRSKDYSFYYEDISSFNNGEINKLNKMISEWNEKYGFNLSIFENEQKGGKFNRFIVYPTKQISTKLIPSDIIEKFDLSTTDINEEYLKDKNLFINHHIYFSIHVNTIYEEKDSVDDNFLRFEKFPDDMKILTFNIYDLPDINLFSYDSISLGRHMFPEYSKKIKTYDEIPLEGDCTTVGFFDDESNTVSLYLLQVEDVYYEIVYAFFVGHGQDGGFGDYTSPQFTHPYIDNGRVIYVKNLDDAEKIRKYLNDTWSKRFYNSGYGEQYSGEFPLEANIIPLTIPNDYDSCALSAEKVISIMENIDEDSCYY